MNAKLTQSARSLLELAARSRYGNPWDDNTKRLMWDFSWLIEYITKFATLKPGDLIFTGTPTGAGGHQTPPKWLKAGDVVEVEVPEIGVLRNTVVDET